jgi:hypothetical protein
VCVCVSPLPQQRPNLDRRGRSFGSKRRGSNAKASRRPGWHRRYATVAAVDANQQVVLTARRIDYAEFDVWIRKQLRKTELVTARPRSTRGICTTNWRRWLPRRRSPTPMPIALSSAGCGLATHGRCEPSEGPAVALEDLEIGLYLASGDVGGRPEEARGATHTRVPFGGVPWRCRAHLHAGAAIQPAQDQAARRLVRDYLPGRAGRLPGRCRALEGDWGADLVQEVDIRQDVWHKKSADADRSVRVRAASRVLAALLV